MFHNFREYVRKVLIHIQQVPMYYQCAGACTRPFPHNVFLKQHKIIYYSHLSVWAEWGRVTMYELASLQHYFMVRFSPQLGILFSNRIKLNLSICYSSQTCYSGQPCKFNSKPGVESQESIQVKWVLRLIYCLNSPLCTI